jgi:hypothetical protein
MDGKATSILTAVGYVSTPAISIITKVATNMHTDRPCNSHLSFRLTGSGRDRCLRVTGET